MRADFYILKETQNPWEIAYRLLEKAYLQKINVFVYAKHSFEATAFDDFLWTYLPEQFLPHGLYEHPKSDQIPIIISTTVQLDPHRTLMLYLDEGPIMDDYGSIDRIIELVPPFEEQKKISRERYKQYQTKGFHLNAHTL